MHPPGEQRPPDTTTRGLPPRGSRSLAQRLRPRSLAAAIGEAALVALAAALAWGLLKGILELGVGLLAVAAFGGWAIGAVLAQVRASALVAVAIAAAAWLGGLVCTWLVAMAILPASARTFPERLTGTPFLEWLAPQFGIVEIAGLALFVVAAAYGARPRR